jgi:hypothetical protein
MKKPVKSFGHLRRGEKCFIKDKTECGANQSLILGGDEHVEIERQGACRITRHETEGS